MFFERKPEAELSPAQVAAAREGFKRILIGRRFSPQFIEAHYEDLLAIAQLEYVRELAKGTEIENPAGWIISCAWRRTKNLLRDENSRPQMVSTDQLAELVDEQTSTSEPAEENEDRVLKVQRAIEELTLEERQVIALMYFEDFSFREAGRALRWTHSKTVRRERSALKTLHRALDVERSDQLAIEVGATAALSVALRRAAERCGQLGGELWMRGHDLLRRLGIGGGGDAAGAVASSGGGRAVGVCASAVALNCLAGAGGFLVPVGGGSAPPPSHRHVPATQRAQSPEPPTQSPVPQPEVSVPTASPFVDTPEAKPRRPSHRSSSPPPQQPARNGEFGAESGGIVVPRGEAAPSPPASVSPASPRGAGAPSTDKAAAGSGAEFAL